MRPITLTLTAFGPFANSVTIDFERLEDLGVYTVSGENGTGKTTIFDGLFFALYGRLPGKRSGNESRVRCDWSDAETITSVKLEFEAHDNLWRVERTPAYVRPKKVGTGTTTQTAKSILRRFDSTSNQWLSKSERSKEIDKECRELIGLDSDQFQRVVLLPQGEFAEILLESSTNRGETLTTLFGTEHFQQVAASLKDKSNKVRKQSDKEKTRLDGAATRINSEVQKRLYKALADYQKDHGGKSGFLSRDTASDSDLRATNSQSAQLDGLDSQQPDEFDGEPTGESEKLDDRDSTDNSDSGKLSEETEQPKQGEHAEPSEITNSALLCDDQSLEALAGRLNDFEAQALPALEKHVDSLQISFNAASEKLEAAKSQLEAFLNREHASGELARITENFGDETAIEQVLEAAEQAKTVTQSHSQLTAKTNDYAKAVEHCLQTVQTVRLNIDQAIDLKVIDREATGVSELLGSVSGLLGSATALRASASEPFGAAAANAAAASETPSLQTPGETTGFSNTPLPSEQTPQSLRAEDVASTAQQTGLVLKELEEALNTQLVLYNTIDSAKARHSDTSRKLSAQRDSIHSLAGKISASHNAVEQLNEWFTHNTRPDPGVHLAAKEQAQQHKQKLEHNQRLLNEKLRLEQQCENLTQELHTNQRSFAAQSELAQQLPKHQEDLEAANSELERLQSLKTNFKEQAGLVEVHQQTELELANNKSSFLQLLEIYAKTQAIELAKDLEDGQPCLVCGSLEHPNPATLEENSASATSVSLEDVNNAKSLLDRSTDRLQSINNDLNQLTSLIGDRNPNEVAEQIEETQNKITAIKALLSAAQSADANLGLLSNAVDSSKRKLNEAQVAVQNKNQELDDLELASHSLDQLLGRIQEAGSEISRASALYESSIAEQNRFIKTEKELASHKTQIEHLQERLQADQHNLVLFEQELKEFSELINTETAKLRMQRPALQQAREVMNRLKANKSELDKLSGQLQPLHHSLVELSERYSAALENSRFASFEHALQACIGDFELEQRKRALQEHRAQVLRLQGRLEQLKDAPVVKPVLQPFEEQKAEHKAALDLAKSTSIVIRDSHTRLAGEHALLTREHAVYLDATREYQQLIRLADIVAGEGRSGHTKINMSLNNWVLSNYLALVIENANRRLIETTSGRFELKVDKEKATSNQDAGLHIEVHDCNTGKSRSAKSLSGSELFRASLALALGLADVVTQNSGGIHVSTMFIDEGFGSLDDNSTDLVLEILKDLSSNAVTVGVITHVKEMLDVLPKGVIVKHAENNRGSVITQPN